MKDTIKDFSITVEPMFVMDKDKKKSLKTTMTVRLYNKKTGKMADFQGLVPNGSPLAKEVKKIIEEVKDTNNIE